jgi:DNA mismatch repair protein MutL
VEIGELFFNTPARLKFLRSPTTELGRCLRHVTALALAYPDVRLRVTHNGRLALSAPEARDLRVRAAAIWGWQVAERLLTVEHSAYGVTVRGLASPPELHRGGREETVVVVNGRPVRDPALLQAVLEAYRPLLPRDRFPLVVLTLALPPTDVDANVHPTKAWVRFRQPQLVQEMIARALADALRRPVAIPTVSLGPSPPDSAARGEIDSPAGPARLLGEPHPVYGTTVFGRILGQVQETFVVTASDQEVFFIDQHAAHERVVFERLERNLEHGGAASQELLFPHPLSLAPAARVLLEQWREPLERLGFVFEGLGSPFPALLAVPGLLGAVEPQPLVEAAVDALRSARGADRPLERILALIACRAAIKAPQPLERAEQERLVVDLAATRTPFFCPHGRPTMSRVALSDIRREVRRRW